MCQQAEPCHGGKEETRSEPIPRVAQISELLRALREVPRELRLLWLQMGTTMNYVGEGSAEASARLVL